MPAEPFTEQQVRKIVQSMERQKAFTDFREKLAARRALLYREQSVGIAGISEKLEYRTPALAANRDRFRNRLRASAIRIQVAAKKTDEVSVKKAQAVENFFHQLYFDFTRRRTATIFAPDDIALDHQVADGIGFRHLEWSDDARSKLFAGKEITTEAELAAALKDAETKGFRGNPFQLFAPDPIAVVWEPDFSRVAKAGARTVDKILEANDDLTFSKDGGFARLTEEQRATALTSDTIGSGIHGSSSDDTIWDNMAEVIDLETNDWVYQIVALPVDGGGEQLMMLSKLPNPAGRPRFAIAPGHLTSAQKPADRFRPLIHDLYALTQLLNITGTLLMTGALNAGRPMLQEVPNSAGSMTFPSILSAPSQERRTIIFDTGEQAWPAPRSEHHWEPITMPTPEQLVIAHQQLISEFGAFGFPQVLSPEASIDATSGYDRARQQEAAADFLDPPLANIAHAWREVFLTTGGIIKKLDIPVTIPVLSEGKDAKRGQIITVKPEDFVDIDVEVGFESIPATVRFAQRESNLRLMEAGLMSKATFMATEYDDPVAEQERIDLGVAGDLAKQKALQDFNAILSQLSGGTMERLAQEAGVALPLDQKGQNGNRPERPAGQESNSPGLGQPLVNPEQRQPGDSNVPSEGTGQNVRTP